MKKLTPNHKLEYDSGNEKTRLQYLMESNGKYDSLDVTMIKKELFTTKQKSETIDEMAMRKFKARHHSK